MITSGRKVRITRTMSDTTAVPIPDPERLGGVLREAEVDGAGEELPAAVEAAGGEELLGADHAQFLEDFGADHVLAAVAPREREVGRAVAAAAGEVGDELGVLVVGVGGHIEHAPQLAEPSQLPQRVLGRHRLRGPAGGGGPASRCAGQEEWDEPTGGPVRFAGASWSGHARAPELGSPSRPADSRAAAMEVGDDVRPFGPLISSR